MDKIDDIKKIEELIILYLGVSDKPAPSMLHLQTGLFLLSKTDPEIEKLLKFQAAEEEKI